MTLLKDEYENANTDFCSKEDRMRWQDALVNRKHFFSIGRDTKTRKYYLEIPVENMLVTYSEYYEIDKEMFDRFLADPESAVPFADQCRRQEMDHLLINKPGKSRGTG